MEDLSTFLFADDVTSKVVVPETENTTEILTARTNKLGNKLQEPLQIDGFFAELEQASELSLCAW